MEIQKCQCETMLEQELGIKESSPFLGYGTIISITMMSFLSDENDACFDFFKKSSDYGLYHM